MDLAVREDRTIEWFNVICPICGKRFHLKPSKVQKGNKHYCSRVCHNIAKREYCKGAGNHQYGLRGNKNASWRGGKRMSNYGYWLVQCIGHPFAWDVSGYVFEHRLVAEKYLLTEENSVKINGKRYLSPDYIVHHKNGNKTDNRPENLEIMKKSQHSAIHSSEPDRIKARNERGQFAKGKPVEIVNSIKGGERGSDGFGSTDRSRSRHYAKGGNVG